MLPAVIVIHVMCMPMGYVVGRKFQKEKANRYEHAIDREMEEHNYSFMPLFCAFILPMGVIIAIQQIINES